jgi:hypothetical protein
MALTAETALKKKHGQAFCSADTSPVSDAQSAGGATTG